MLEIDEWTRKRLLYPSPIIRTPFHRSIESIYCDYIATGRSSPYIEEYVNDNILPIYGNIHSNSSYGTKMTKMVKKTRTCMRKIFNIPPSHKIIFTGNGATQSINHLIQTMGSNINSHTHIYISVYEHNSNYLPWTKTKAKIHIIPLNENGDIDYQKLNYELQQQSGFKIISITACSNVTGIRTNIPLVQDFAKNNNALLFIDYACSAPYDDIIITDACFISPHKFLGGNSTPGVLIARADLFNDIPFLPGGGSVTYIDSTNIDYDSDIEKRESGGTPNIVGIIKLKAIFMLKESFKQNIKDNEEFIMKYVFDKFMDCPKNLIVLFPNNRFRLPILTFSIYKCHFNLTVKLLNDIFGIQSRGGNMCCGLLAEYLNSDGWCRISFNWIQTKYEIDRIIFAIKYVAQNWYKYEHYYSQNGNVFMM